MRSFIFCVCLLLCSSYAFAQELAFIHKTQNKVITARVGSKMHLAYIGYNNQLEYCANLVLAITDSTITLGNKPLLRGKKHLNQNVNQLKVIRIADIVAFRKRSAGAEIVKNFAQIGAIVVSAVLLSNLYSASNIGSGTALITSLSAGLSINLAMKGLFPENAKYFIKDGWEIKYLQIPVK